MGLPEFRSFASLVARLEPLEQVSTYSVEKSEAAALAQRLEKHFEAFGYGNDYLVVNYDKWSQVGDTEYVSRCLRSLEVLGKCLDIAPAQFNVLALYRQRARSILWRIKTLPAHDQVSGRLERAYREYLAAVPADEPRRLLVDAFRIELSIRETEDSDVARIQDVGQALRALGEPGPFAMPAPDATCGVTPLAWLGVWALSQGHVKEAREAFSEASLTCCSRILRHLADLLQDCDSGVPEEARREMVVPDIRGLARIAVGKSWQPEPLDVPLVLSPPSVLEPDATPLQLEVAIPVLAGLDLSNALFHLGQHILTTWAGHAKAVSAAVHILRFAFSFGGSSDDEEENALCDALLSTDGLALLDEVPELAAICAQHIGTPSQRTWFALRAAGGLLADPEGGIDPEGYIFLDPEIPFPDVDDVAREILELGKVHPDAGTRLPKLWGELVKSVFVRCGELKRYARAFSLLQAFEPLIPAHEAYVPLTEHVAGDPRRALERYCKYLQFDPKVPGRTVNVDWALGNMSKLIPDLRERPDRAEIAFSLSLESGFLSGTLKESERQKLAAIVRELEAPPPAPRGFRQGIGRKPTATTTPAVVSGTPTVAPETDDWLRTALARWPKVTGPARKVLVVIHQVGRVDSFAQLGEYAGMDAMWAERHFKALKASGMVIGTVETLKVNPHIAPLLDRELQHTVSASIVRASTTLAAKPLFNSNREFAVYQVLVQLCPNHLVFPNVAVQAIMSFDKMKELVDSEDFGYFLRASVDFAVVSSTTYLPMFAIELDSTWHDTDEQKVRDDRKDRLFSVSGIPFMRLRPLGSPSPETIRGEIANHLDALVKSLRIEMPGYAQAKDLLIDLAKNKGPDSQ